MERELELNFFLPKILNCRTALALAIILLLLAGCSPLKNFSHSRYSAEAIRAEYGGISASSAKAATQTPANGTGTTQPPSTTKGRRNSPLSLSQAIDTAVSSNPSIQQAIHRIARAKAMKTMADAAFWPFVGVYTEYTQGDAPSAYLFKTIDQRRLPPDINFNDPGWFENWESGINARMNLFNGGKDLLEGRMAEQDVDISNLQRLAVTNELTAQVISAFFDILAAREFVQIAEESIATVSQQLRIIRVQYEGGGALKSDVLSLQVRQAEAREALVNSRNRLKLARAGLANLMGLDPSAFAEKRTLLVQTAEPRIHVPATYEEGIVSALSNRPELEKMRSQLVKFRMKLDAAQAHYLPSVDLVGKYYVDDPGLDYDRDRENWTAALVMNWDLFTGFARNARIQQSDAMVQEMLAADRETLLDIKLDVKSAYLDRQAARARYKVAASSVERAEESYQLVKTHYQGGAVTITRYLEAELDRNRARTRATAAFYDKIKATADLARAIGKWAGRNRWNNSDRHEK